MNGITFSRYGKMAFPGQNLGANNEREIDSVLQRIQDIDKPTRQTLHVKVPERLLQTHDKKLFNATIKVRTTRRKKKPIKRQKVAFSHTYVRPKTTEAPSAADYNPNFDAVLSSGPKMKFGKSGLPETNKKMNLDTYTMNEMLNCWSTVIRNVDFDNSHEPITENIKQNPTRVQGRGLMDSKAKRYSLVRNEDVPGPGAYQIPSSLGKPVTTKSGFESQAGRRVEFKEATVIRDVRHGIDYCKPRTSQCISFDKQSGREKPKQENDIIWDEIEAEQQRIIASLKVPEISTNQKKPKRQDFECQTGRPAHPFQHLMPHEVYADVNYDVEKSLKSLDRPVTSFDIRQPGLKDRSLFRTSDAPDVIYDIVPYDRATTSLGKASKRRSPYDYMPKTCGAGEYMEPGSTLTGKRSLDMSKMGTRETMLETPGTFKRRI